MSLKKAVRQLKHRWRTRVAIRSAPILHREAIRRDWTDHKYYGEAEDEASVAVFWSPASLFRRAFDTLDLTYVIDIACGRGRHTAQIVHRAQRLVLVDVNESNVEACRKRFADCPNVECLRNSGSDLVGIPDAAATAVFCYDAMVHFEASDVIAYLGEINRVLKPGGRALLHYSNFDENPGGFYRDNPGHRNFFSERMMRHFADRAGLGVVEHAVFPWALGASGRPTDGMILLRK